MKFNQIALIVAILLCLLFGRSLASLKTNAEQRQPARPQLIATPLNNSGWQLIELDYHNTRHVYLFHSRALGAGYAETITKVAEIPVVRQ